MKVEVADVTVGGDSPFVLIAGPCVIENKSNTLELAEEIQAIAGSLDIPYIFKTSYDKANRTSVNSYRGPGLEKGLDVLREVKEKLALPILTDVHCQSEIESVAEVVDVLQIPAFLSRQTDLVIKVAETDKVVNIKKGQFLAPHDLIAVIEKVTSTGNKKILITERGTSFGYNNLVVDMRAIPMIRETGYPLIFDATHAVQLPGGLGNASAGERDMVSFLARGATAVGIDGLFLEVHFDPDNALCDGPNSLEVSTLKEILSQIKKIDDLVREMRLRG
jgi:2-dehydro-3-deoxyphosphooctonate aldolase (KDO 8-P synthase)